VSDPIDPGEPREHRSFSIRLIVPLLTVVALGAAVAWWLRPPADHQPPTAAVPVPKPAAESAPPPSAPVVPATPRPTPKTTRPDEKPAEPSPAPVATSKVTLNVSSDVEGAHVFVDRKYIGNTPLRTSDVTPGRHQLNVSADGYDGVSESVDVADAATTDLYVSLKTVRLNVSVPVVHKHTFGSCEGTLRADPAGLRYDTPNTSDAFAISLSDLEVFSTDYAQKTLKVKQRGGKTWNFTTKAATADSLVSFQQAVDHARQKLGRQ
jgi:hypothetical protein